MTFSYTEPDGSGVFATLKDNVRYLAQDTVDTAQSATDEEIVYLLTISTDDVFAAAALAVDRRANRWESTAATTAKNKKVGDLSLGDKDFTSIVSGLRGLALRLRGNGANPSEVIPVVAAPVNNADAVFTIGMMSS